MPAAAERLFRFSLPALAIVCFAPHSSAQSRVTLEPGTTPTTVKLSLANRLRVPAGTFVMGASVADQRKALELCLKEVGVAHQQACRPMLFTMEGPERRVFLPAFEIDQTEVSVGEYRVCADAAHCSPTPLLPKDERFTIPEVPVTNVTHEEAQLYCKYRKGRLPTEAEWERVARGVDGRIFPWGNTHSNTSSNHGRFAGEDISTAAGILLRPDETDGWPFVAPVLSLVEGRSPVGAFHMAGNVSEWTLDAFSEEPPQRASVARPRGPKEGTFRAVRGGSFRQPLIYQRTTSREGVLPETRSAEIGFRCAYDLGP